MTSVTRRIVPLPDGAGNVTSSTKGRCGSSSVRSVARPGAELGERSDADHLRGVGVVAPDRQRGAPVPVARERPVDVVLEPPAVAAVLDVRRVPVRPLVLLDQAVADLGGADEPRGQRVVDQRRVAAPAVRIRVLVGLGAPQHAARAELVDQRRVRALEEHPADQRDVGVEVPVRADRVDHLEALGLGHEVVLGAERGRHVHQAGAGVGGHVVAVDDAVCVSEALVGDQVERAAVVAAEQVGAREAVGHPGVLAQHRQQVLGDDEVVTVADGGAHVGDVAGDGDGGVRRQRPGRRRPDQEVGAGPGTVGEREAHVDRGVDVVLVPEGDLVVGQRRLVARAVRRDAVVLDEQALVEDGLERPPDALDVARGHGQVGLVEVHPVAHALGHRGERRDVAQRGLLARRVELRDAVLLDVALAREAELLLHRELDREAVAVPAGATRDAVAPHRLEPREEVLERPGLDVVGAGPAVGRRRPLVEDPRLTARGALEAATEHVAVGPAGQHLALDGGQVHARGQGGERGLAGGGGRRRTHVSIFLVVRQPNSASLPGGPRRF